MTKQQRPNSVFLHFPSCSFCCWCHLSLSLETTHLEVKACVVNLRLFMIMSLVICLLLWVISSVQNRCCFSTLYCLFLEVSIPLFLHTFSLSHCINHISNSTFLVVSPSLPFPLRWLAVLPREVLRDERRDRFHRHQQRLGWWFVQAVLQGHQPPEQSSHTERSASLSIYASTSI